jgi:hypothetical protein
MRKIIILTSFLLISIILIAVLYFSNLAPGSRNNEKILAYIPRETALIFQFKNDKSFYEIFKDYQLFNTVLGKQRVTEIAELQSLLFKQPQLAEATDDQTVFLSVYPNKADSLDLLWVIASNGKLPADQIDQFARLSSGDFKTEKILVSGQDVLGITIKSLNKTFYLFLNKTFLAGSFSKSVIEKFLDKKTLKIKKEFIDEINTFGHKNDNSPFNVFINHESTFTFLEKFLRNKASGNFMLLKQLEGSSILNMNFKSDAFMFNGISKPDPGTANYFNVFLNQKPVITTVKNMFPENTANFIAFGISDFALFHSNLLQLFKKRNELSKLTTQIGRINNNNGANTEMNIEKLWSNQFATVQLATNENLAVIAVKNGQQMDLLLESLSNTYSENIRKFTSSNLLYYYFGDPLKPFLNPYYTIIDNYLIAANDPGTLNHFLTDYTNDKLLYKTPRFSEFNQLIANQSNIMFLINNKNSTGILRNNLKKNYFKLFDEENSGFKNFYGLSYQWSADGNHFLTNFNVNYISTTASKLDVVWKYKMNGRLAIVPQIISDTDSQKLVLVQDNVNNVYVFSSDGKKRWSTQLSGRILGDVHQLSDNTLLFNTGKSIYRVDVSGITVKGFPITLSQQASYGLTINDKDVEKLKFFVPCATKIAAFNASGSLIPGWDDPLSGKILFDLKSVKLNDINYIIAGTENGQFYFFDHSGNIIGKSADVPKNNFKNPINLDINTNLQDSRIVSTDTSGTIKTIFFNGKTTEKNTGVWSGEHLFDLQNITGNITPEWVYLDKSQLYVYNSDNTLAYNYNFGSDINNRPQYFPYKSVYQIGISSSKDNLLYLFSEDGSFVKGFPIEGVPNFYVGSFINNGFRYLICGDKSNYLYVYKL